MQKTTAKLLQLFIVMLWLLLSHWATGQAPSIETLQPFRVSPDVLRSPALDSAKGVLPPPMSAELALKTYYQRTALQSERLAGFSAVTVIHADLPSLSRRGEYKLQSRYLAPCTLEFNSGHYIGDGFVKSNVIVRLLQSEVDRVRKGDAAQTAVISANYKFSHPATLQINGRLVHAYETVPRTKRPGLFKGRIYLDPFTGALVRAEGVLVKTPSFFIKNVTFVQDYAQFGGFTFPVHVHVVVNTRMVGRAVIDIYHRDYHSVAADTSLRETRDRLPDGALGRKAGQLDSQAPIHPMNQ